MEIITIDDKKYVVVQKVLLDRFASDEARNKFLDGKIRILNRNNPNECIIAEEVIDVQFEDITGSKEPEPLKKELDHTDMGEL